MKLGTLFRSAIDLIRLDPVILAPSIMTFVGLRFLEDRFIGPVIPDLTESAQVPIDGLLILWIALLISTVYVLAFSFSLLRNQAIDLSASMKHASRNLFSVLISVSLLLPVAYGLFLLLSTIAAALSGIAVLQFFVNIVLILVMCGCLLVFLLLIETIPLFILGQNLGPIQGLRLAVSHIRTHPKTTFKVVSFTYLLRLFATFFSAMFMGIPVVGEAVFLAVFRGCGHGVSALVLARYFETYIIKQSR